MCPYVNQVYFLSQAVCFSLWRTTLLGKACLSRYTTSNGSSLFLATPNLLTLVYKRLIRNIKTSCSVTDICVISKCESMKSWKAINLLNKGNKFEAGSHIAQAGLKPSIADDTVLLPILPLLGITNMHTTPCLCCTGGRIQDFMDARASTQPSKLHS